MVFSREKRWVNLRVHNVNNKSTHEYWPFLKLESIRKTESLDLELGKLTCCKNCQDIISRLKTLGFEVFSLQLDFQFNINGTFKINNLNQLLPKYIYKQRTHKILQ
uniref:Uncharacterized protein n=1 Tax=Cacopsylla melanoneura TaxID=428564 RepID=A0A8D9EM65_9HEMI